MNSIQNFAFEEHLVRVIDVDGAPWFAGKDVCAALEIRDHKQALETLDDDERGGYTVPPPSGISGRGGGEQSMIVVSEPGVYRLVFRSRKPEAERFKRWLAHEVLPSIRKTGVFDARGASATGTPLVEIDIQHAPLAAKVSMLHWITKVRGREAAVAYLDFLGLPAIPAPAPDTEPQKCLLHLLDAKLDDGGTISELLRAGLAGVVEAEPILREHGIRLGEGSFYVANTHPFILRLYRPTRWRQHYRFLRRLDGAAEAKVMNYGRVTQSARGVELPAYYADDEVLQ